MAMDGSSMKLATEGLFKEPTSTWDTVSVGATITDLAAVKAKGRTVIEKCRSGT